MKTTWQPLSGEFNSGGKMIQIGLVSAQSAAMEIQLWACILTNFESKKIEFIVIIIAKEIRGPNDNAFIVWWSYRAFSLLIIHYSSFTN